VEEVESPRRRPAITRQVQGFGDDALHEFDVSDEFRSSRTKPTRVADTLEVMPKSADTMGVVVTVKGLPPEGPEVLVNDRLESRVPSKDDEQLIPPQLAFDLRHDRDATRFYWLSHPHEPLVVSPSMADGIPR